MTGYQWTVVFAAWLGWGFDVFDGLLFNFIAPNCIPTLLGLPIGSPEASARRCGGPRALTSLLLLGWALGGTVFGRIADRIGRTRTLMLTMLMYSIGTALCAFAPNLWSLAAFSGSSRAWALAASGRPAPRWWRKPFPRSAGSRPGRCCTPLRRSAWRWPRW